jgi:hypothetical protein
MSDEHFPREVLERFVESRLSPPETAAVVRHLLARCGRCNTAVGSVLVKPQEQAGRIEGSGEPRHEASRYDRVFDRILRVAGDAETRLAAEKERAFEQWEVLEGHPQARRLMMIRNDDRLQTWGLYERLLAECREAGRHNPVAAMEIARLALVVLDHLDPFVLGEERLADFRAAGLGALANVKRLARDFPGASEALRQAWAILERGTEDPVEEATLLCLEVSLLCDLGQFERAVDLIGGMGVEGNPGVPSGSDNRPRGESAPRRVRWTHTSRV